MKHIKLFEELNEAESATKKYTIECENSGGFGSNRPSRYYYQEGTLEELIKAYSYTLETGKSYEREKGNSKINISPKNIEGLIKNLNNAVNNSAADGYAGKTYRLLPEGEPRQK